MPTLKISKGSTVYNCTMYENYDDAKLEDYPVLRLDKNGNTYYCTIGSTDDENATPLTINNDSCVLTSKVLSGTVFTLDNTFSRNHGMEILVNGESKLQLMGSGASGTISLNENDYLEFEPIYTMDAGYDYFADVDDSGVWIPLDWINSYVETGISTVVLKASLGGSIGGGGDGPGDDGTGDDF